MNKRTARKRKKPAPEPSGQGLDTEAWLASLPAAVRRDVEADIDGYIRHLDQGLDDYFKRRGMTKGKQ